MQIAADTREIANSELPMIGNRILLQIFHIFQVGTFSPPFVRGVCLQIGMENKQYIGNGNYPAKEKSFIVFCGGNRSKLSMSTNDILESMVAGRAWQRRVENICAFVTNKY